MTIVTPKEACAQFDTYPQKLIRLVDRGIVRCSLTRGGHRRYRLEDLQEYFSPYNIVVEANPKPAKESLELVDAKAEIAELKADEVTVVGMYTKLQSENESLQKSVQRLTREAVALKSQIRVLDGEKKQAKKKGFAKV